MSGCSWGPECCNYLLRPGTKSGDLGLANYPWYLAERFLSGKKKKRPFWNSKWREFVVKRSSRVAQYKRDREIIRRGFLYPWRIHKCVSVYQTLWRQIYLESVYTDCLHFVCILANRIGVTKERSRRVGFSIGINKPSVFLTSESVLSSYVGEPGWRR